MSKGLHGLGCTRSKIAVPMGIVGPDAQRLLNHLVEILLMRRMERNGKYVLVLNCVHFGYLVEFSNEPLIICIRVDIADKEPFAISAI